MKELTFEQVEEVSGGNPWVVGIGIGVVGNYVYDSIGGKEGIDKALSEIWDAGIRMTQNASTAFSQGIISVRGTRIKGK